MIQTNSTTIAREVKLIAHIYEKHGIEYATSKAKIIYMKLQHLDNNHAISNPDEDIESFDILSPLRQALKDNLSHNTKVDLANKKQEIRILYQASKGTLVFTRSYKHLVSPTTYVFIVWMISLTILLMIVSLIFSKNQIKSILALAKAADNFVFEKNTNEIYKPSGATEIRRAGISFLRMKKRIENYIAKRTQTLAMISHDLKTPLTRLKLQLEMLDQQSPEIQNMKQDADSMKQMIDSYLDFARGEGGENFQCHKIMDWFKKRIKSSNYKSLKIKYIDHTENSEVLIKPLAFQRAIDNIISNASKYANRCQITFSKREEAITIEIEDDGVGIKDDYKGKVLKPFYRLDAARNIESEGSVGLGLSITNEIIIGHNGQLELLDSKELGGLKVKIILPIPNM
jgi:two-component system osmolarity sensor histidine kinase EnvZ